MNPVSAGLRLAVQAGNAEAQAEGARFVTNDHLMLGILALQKDPTIKPEFGRLESLLAAFRLEAKALRRTLRAQLVVGSAPPAGGKPAALSRASQMTIEAGSRDADGSPGTCLSLFAAILLRPGPGLTAALRKHGISEGQLLESAAKAYPPVPLARSWLESISGLGLEETIFVLDLCGSTPLACKDEKMAYHLKKRLREISYALLVSNSASYTQSTGDGWLATFERAGQGISAAKAVLKGLAERNRRSRNPPIHIRVALHSGKTYLLKDNTLDRHGGSINLACRIEGVLGSSFRDLKVSLPVRDRILCSYAFLDRYTRETGKTDLSPVLCGNADLKGIPEPVRIFLIPW